MTNFVYLVHLSNQCEICDIFVKDLRLQTEKKHNIKSTKSPWNKWQKLLFTLYVFRGGVGQTGLCPWKYWLYLSELKAKRPKKGQFLAFTKQVIFSQFRVTLHIPPLTFSFKSYCLSSVYFHLSNRLSWAQLLVL